MSNKSLLYFYKIQFRRELAIFSKDKKSAINALLFFLMIIVFFPLTIPAGSANLTMITPGVIWIGIVLAVFLAAERLFSQDYTDGVIEQWFIAEVPISTLVLAKLSVYWLINTSSIIVLSPFIAILLHLNLYTLFILILSVTFATPTIVALCALAEAFAAGLQQKAILMALIVLPLNIPVLILGSSAVSAAKAHDPVTGILAILLAITCIAVVCMPFAIAGVVKICLAE